MALTLITPDTVSSEATSSFTSIDSTYKLYIFKFINISPETDDAEFQFNTSTDGGSNYNGDKNTQIFSADCPETGGSPSYQYESSYDLAAGSGTGFQSLSIDPEGSGTAADSSGSGELYLFDPSNATTVCYFNSRFTYMSTTPGAWDVYASGYVNAAADVDAVQFKCSSGDFSGIIKMYGVT